MLLRAIALVRREYPQVKLYVPGVQGRADGSLIVNSGYTRYIADLIEQSGIAGNVCFIGGQSTQDVISHLQRAHACVVSSAIEGASATLREGMHIGTPCICAYRGGMTELLRDRESGFYYDYSEYPYLAERIKQLFADDDMARRFSVEAIHDAEIMHNRDENAKKWLDVYRQIYEE